MNVSRPANPPAGIILVQAFARWAMWAVIIVSGLLGLENDFGLGRLASFAIMAFLGYAFVSLGEGLMILLWKPLGFLLPLLHLHKAAENLKVIPPAMAGRLLPPPA